ncbi:MAG: type II toxin-antitoxin system RelB/DinJ family antitoxin [Bacilli bacterium]|nr:type II toxin-antitoxin system RelB/DinJ family antitoxin [Bacilli bacterium]
MNNTTNLNIRIDKAVKESSEKVFEELGLNMTTAINIFLRQVIRVNGIPFEIKGNIPKQETIEAMEESIAIANGKEKGYTNIDDLKKALEV